MAVTFQRGVFVANRVPVKVELLRVRYYRGIGGMETKPRDGFVYVRVDVKVTNTGQRDIEDAATGLSDASWVGTDGEQMPGGGFFGAPWPGLEQVDAGNFATGSLAFEVPSKPGELRFSGQVDPALTLVLKP